MFVFCVWIVIAICCIDLFLLYTIKINQIAMSGIAFEIPPQHFNGHAWHVIATPTGRIRVSICLYSRSTYIC